MKELLHHQAGDTSIIRSHPNGGTLLCDVWGDDPRALGKDLVSAYNAMHGAGINPAAVKPLMDALDKFKAAALKSGLEFGEDVATEWWAIEEALTLAKEQP